MEVADLQGSPVPSSRFKFLQSLLIKLRRNEGAGTSTEVPGLLVTVSASLSSMFESFPV